MSFAVLGMGTALPEMFVNQSEGARENSSPAKALCCKTEEHATWLPTMFDHTGIDKRHMAFDRQVMTDILEGTRLSQSVFLPSGAPDDAGPTTGQRMDHYAEHAGPLALAVLRGRCSTDRGCLRTKSRTSLRCLARDFRRPAWTIR